MSQAALRSVFAAGKRFDVLESNDGLLRAQLNGANGYQEVWARATHPEKSDGYAEVVKCIERALSKVPTMRTRSGRPIKKSLAVVWPGLAMRAFGA